MEGMVTDRSEPLNLPASPRPSMPRAGGGFRVRLGIGLAAMIVFYLYSYARFRTVPGNEFPLGWFGWTDVGRQLASAQAFAAFDFITTVHHYPPLWPLMAAPFVGWLPQHPFLVPSVVCLAVYAWGLVRIGERTYGVALTWLTLVPMMVLLLRGSTGGEYTLNDEWIMPWNSSAVAAVSSTLFVIYHRFDTKAHPWRCDQGRDLALVGAFYLLYGALLALRPLDVVVFFPLVLIAFLQLVRAGVAAGRTGVFRRLASLAVVIGVSGLAVPLAYFAFNEAVFGDPFGGYLSEGVQNGYFPGELLTKAVAVGIDGYGLHLETSQTIREHFWLFPWAIAATLVAIVFCRGIIRVIALSAVCAMLINIPYGDLTPNTLYRFNTIHYFKWVFPWIALILVGQTCVWLRGYRAGWRSVLPLACIAVLGLAISSVRFHFPRFELVPVVQAPDQNRIDIVLDAPTAFAVVDLLGVDGDRNDVIGATHDVVVDGVPLRNLRDFRFLQAPWGTRLLVTRQTTARHIEIVFSRPINMTGGNGLIRIGTYGYAFGCAWWPCRAPCYATADGTAPDPGRFPDAARTELFGAIVRTTARDGDCP